MQKFKSIEQSRLASLCGGYLNYDWDLEYDDPLDAVDDFGAGQPEELLSLASEVGGVLERVSDDELPLLWWDVFYAGYPATGGGVEIRAFLKEVRIRAEVLAMQQPTEE